MILLLYWWCARGGLCRVGSNGSYLIAFDLRVGYSLLVGFGFVRLAGRTRPRMRMKQNGFIGYLEYAFTISPLDIAKHSVIAIIVIADDGLVVVDETGTIGVRCIGRSLLDRGLRGIKSDAFKGRFQRRLLSLLNFETGSCRFGSVSCVIGDIAQDIAQDSLLCGRRHGEVHILTLCRCCHWTIATNSYCVR